MMNKKTIAILLSLVFLFCLIPTAAFALGEQDTTPVIAGETENGTPAEDTKDTGEAAGEEPAAEEPEELPDAEEAAPEEEESDEAEAEEAEPVTVAAEESFYAKAGDVVFNNGGTVYNNGGTVYNNGGTVYANLGATYNNGGVVYANRGTIYNNGGTVYNNGAKIFSNGGQVKKPLPEGSFLLTLDGSAELLTLEGLEPAEDAGQYLGVQEEGASLSAPEGYRILDFQAEGAEAALNEDGALVLSDCETQVSLSLRLQTLEPTFSLSSGTYPQGQTLKLEASEGAEIYYTLDGTQPELGACLRYEEPITLETGMVVNALAVAPGAEPSDVVSAQYAVLSIRMEKFEDMEAGGERQRIPVEVENLGTVDAVIQSVALGGEDADSFNLSSGQGLRLKAGQADDSTWTLRPIRDLKAGNYKASVIFTLDSGETVELDFQLTVN